MPAAMPPDALPPDDERESDPGDANVVDPAVLAERRAQRAEHAERFATRRAADAQSLAAELARERARLEAERDAARAEAAAAREGADAVKAEARHVQAELEHARAERDAMRAELARARAAMPSTDAPAELESAVAPPPRNGNGNGGPPVAWATGLRRELAVARGAAGRPTAAAAPAPRATTPSATLARERELVARRAAEPLPAARPVGAPSQAPVARVVERATPLTALALERERSSRLQAQLERAAATERELRAQVAALQQAVQARREAEERVEVALRRVREDLEAAQRLDAVRAPAASASAPASPPVAAPAGTQPSAAEWAVVPAEDAATTPAPGLAIDADRLNAARQRLRAETTAAAAAPASGPPSAWLPTALRRLMRDDPATAGRILTGLLPAQGLVTHRALRYDLVLAERGCIGVDVGEDGTLVRPQAVPRARREVDFRVTADEAGLARLLLGRRGLRRRARVRGSHRRLRELRRLAREPLALRDVASAGAALDPALAFTLVALAVDPADTFGRRFTIAHAPLPGGPPDAWLRVQDGGPLSVLRTRPGETPTLTIRSTRGALLPILAGIAPPPGEAAAIDGDADALTLLRGWVVRTESRGG
jgi:hypothetical protein